MSSAVKNFNLPMHNENIILGIISIALFAYLIFAMVRPEKF
jgi:K+-transporting ATPase KdpF subunit